MKQSFFAFGNLRVGDAAIDRTGGGALFMVEKADTFGAFLRSDIVDILGQRRMRLRVRLPRVAAGINRVVRASRQAGTAIDAFFGDNRRHLGFESIADNR